MPVRQWFGITTNSIPEHPRRLYTPDAPAPENLTFDVSNNRILASVDQYGTVRQAAIVTRLDRRQLGGFNLRGVPGSKVLITSGTWRIKVLTDPPEAATTAVDYERDLLPVFIQKMPDLEVRRHIFAPVDDRLRQAPRAIIQRLELTNTGTTERTCTISAETETPAASLPFERVIPLDTPAGTDALTQTCSLPPGASSVISFAFLLGENDGELQQTQAALNCRTATDWHDRTLAWHTARIGTFSIPQDSFWPAFLVRMSELCRQPIMYKADGTSGGTFIGSNLQHSEMWNRNLWMKDCFYEVLPMSMLAPELCADAIPFFLDWGMPAAPYGRGTERFPDAVPETHSISLALAPFILAGKYYEATGDTAWFKAYPELLAAARQRLKAILDSRATADIFLFPSMYISDGDARGDWHTGSNLLAWYAFHAMARIAADAYGDTGLARDWADIAGKIARDLRTHCTGDSPQGRRYYEGAHRDGSFVTEKDGEESDMALMPFYGFTPADDPALILHHRIGMSTANPLYSKELDAIWWFDNSWHGATFPAWVTALAGVSEENELKQRLERIATLSDVDGSVWWWPYRYGETNRDAVQRGPVKCAWAAGVFVCKFIHDVVGLRVDVPDRRITFRPFHPWNHLSWTDCRIGSSLFDIEDRSESRSRSVRIRNRNPEPYQATIELALPAGTELADCLINGRPGRTHTITRRYGRKAVLIERELGVSQTITIRLDFEAQTKDTR